MEHQLRAATFESVRQQAQLQSSPDGGGGGDGEISKATTNSVPAGSNLSPRSSQKQQDVLEASTLSPRAGQNDDKVAMVTAPAVGDVSRQQQEEEPGELSPSQFAWLRSQEARKQTNNRPAKKGLPKQKARKYKQAKNDRQVREEAAELLARIDSASRDSSSHRGGAFRNHRRRRQQPTAQGRNNNIPTVVTPTTSSNPQSRSRSVICYWIVPLILMFFMALTAAGLSMVVMGYFEKEDDWESKIDPLEGIRRMDNMQAFLVANRISSSSIFADTTKSPHIRAAQWLAWEDRAHVDIPGVNANAKEAYPFVTRYVLAVLFFATGGPNWTHKLDFLSVKDVCEWKGTVLSDNGGTVNLGVSCDEDGTIAEINLSEFALYSISFLSQPTICFEATNKTLFSFRWQWPERRITSRTQSLDNFESAPNWLQPKNSWFFPPGVGVVDQSRAHIRLAQPNDWSSSNRTVCHDKPATHFHGLQRVRR